MGLGAGIEDKPASYSTPSTVQYLLLLVSLSLSFSCALSAGGSSFRHERSRHSVTDASCSWGLPVVVWVLVWTSEAWNVVFRRTTSSYGLLPTCTLGDIQPELVLAHAGIDPPLAHGMAAAGYYQSNKGAESHEHTELHARAAEQADDVSYSQVSTVHVPYRDRKTARPLPVTDTAAPMRR